MVSDRQVWLEALAPGDPVLVVDIDSGEPLPGPRVVQLRTTTGLSISGIARRFDTDQGQAEEHATLTWRRLEVRPIPASHPEEQERRALATALRRTPWMELPLEELRRISSAVEIVRKS